MLLGEAILFYGDNSFKTWWCGQINNLIFPLKHNTYLKYETRIWAKIHSHTGVLLYKPGMCDQNPWCDSEEIIQICVQIFRLTPKTYIEKMQLYRGNPSIHVIIRGVCPKITFLLLPLYDCMFSWTPCPRVMKIADLGDKSMQILNTKVNLLSEQALTMNGWYLRIIKVQGTVNEMLQMDITWYHRLIILYNFGGLMVDIQKGIYHGIW